MRLLRNLLILLSKATWAKRLITRWGFAWRAASRFISGETEADAIRAVQQLNRSGINATLDHLGENTTSTAAASQAVEDILSILDEIERSEVRANVSIKLSQIGLLLNAEQCFTNLLTIVRHAALRNNFIRIDMEDSSLTEVTLDLFRQARQTGLTNLGIVVQSYLYRTEDDVRSLMASGERVRLVKGAYLEPAEVAYPNKNDVDACFDRLSDLLIEGTRQAGCPVLSDNGRVPPVAAIASHDVKRIEYAKHAAQQAELPKGAIEFQMLLGIRRDLQEQLAAEGYPVRIYVPYGTHWYPYYMRRLAERPANVWFVLSNLLRERN